MSAYDHSGFTVQPVHLAPAFRGPEPEPIRYADDETVKAITERHVKRWRVALDRMAEWPGDGPDAA